ncbi:mitochondrial translation factor ATP22, partial [Acrasis kona]
MIRSKAILSGCEFYETYIQDKKLEIPEFKKGKLSLFALHNNQIVNKETLDVIEDTNILDCFKVIGNIYTIQNQTEESIKQATSVLYMVIQKLPNGKHAFYIGRGKMTRALDHFTLGRKHKNQKQGYLINLVAANVNPKDIIPG